MESSQHSSSVTGAPNVLNSKAFYTAELKQLEYDSIKDDQSLVKSCKLERYYCDKCLFTTKDPQLYKKHIFQHDEIKFVCSYCNHVSYTKGEFQWHLVSHTGNFPYRCEYCEYGAVRKDYIVKHTKRVHEILKIKGPSNLGSGQLMTNVRSVGHVPRTFEKTIKSEPEEEEPISLHLPLNLEIGSQARIDGNRASGTFASLSYSAFMETSYVQVELIAPLQTVKPGMPLTVVAPPELIVPANCLAEVVELRLVNGIQQLLLKLIPEKEVSSRDVGTDGQATEANVRENQSKKSMNCSSSYSQGLVSSSSFTCTRRLAKIESPQLSSYKAWQMQTPCGTLGSYNAKLKTQTCGVPSVQKPDVSKIVDERNQVACSISRGSNQESSSLSLGKFFSETVPNYQRAANHSDTEIRASQNYAVGNVLERNSSGKCFMDRSVLNKDGSGKEKVYTHSSTKVETCTTITVSSGPSKGRQSNSLLESSCKSFKGLPSEKCNSTVPLKNNTESENYVLRSHAAQLAEETRQGPRISSVFSLNCRPAQALQGAKRNLEHGCSIEAGNKIKRMNNEPSNCPELQSSNTGSRFSQPCVQPRSSPLESYQASVQISKSPVANAYHSPGHYNRAYVSSSLTKANSGCESNASLSHASSPAASQSLISHHSETSGTANSSGSHSKFVQSLRPPKINYTYAVNHGGETIDFRPGKIKDLEVGKSTQKCERMLQRDCENISEPDSVISKNRTYQSSMHYSGASAVSTGKLQSSPVHDSTQPKVGTSVIFYETCSEDANSVAPSCFDYSVHQKTIGIGLSPFQSHKQKANSTLPSSQTEKEPLLNARDNLPAHYYCQNSTSSDVRTEMSVPVVKVQSSPAQDSTHSKIIPSSGFYDSSTAIKSSLSSYPIYRMQQTVNGFSAFQSPSQKPESVCRSSQNDKKPPTNTRENVYPHYYCKNIMQHSGSSEVSKQPDSLASSPLHDSAQSKNVTSSALNEHCTVSVKNSTPSNSEYGLQQRTFDKSFKVFQNTKQKVDNILPSPQNEQSSVLNMRENMSLPYLFQRNLLSGGTAEFSNCTGRLPPSAVHDHTCTNSSSLFHDQCSLAAKNAMTLNSDYGIQQKTADRLDVFQNPKQKTGSALPLPNSDRNPALNTRENIIPFPFVFQSTFMPTGAPELLAHPDRAPPNMHNSQSNAAVSSVLYENSSLNAKTAVPSYPYYSIQQRNDIGFSAFQDPKQKTDSILPLSQTESFIFSTGGTMPSPFYCHSSMSSGISSDLSHTSRAPPSPMHDPSRSKMAISSVLYEKCSLSDKNAASSNSDYVCHQKTVDAGFNMFQSPKHPSENAFSSPQNEKNHILNAGEGVSNPYFCQGSIQPSRTEIPNLGVGSLSSPMHSTQSKSVSSVLYEKCLFAATSGTPSYPPYSVQQKAVDSGFVLFPSPKQKTDGMVLSPQNETSHVLSAEDMSVPYYCQSTVLSSGVPEIASHSGKSSLPILESTHSEATVSSLMFEKTFSVSKNIESLTDSGVQQKTDLGFSALQTPKQRLDVLSVQKNEISPSFGTDASSIACYGQVGLQSRNPDISNHSYNSPASPRHKVQTENAEPSTFSDTCSSAAKDVSSSPDFSMQQKTSPNSVVFQSPKQKLGSISASQGKHDALLNKKEATSNSYYCHNMLLCTTSEMSNHTVASSANYAVAPSSPQNNGICLKAAFTPPVGKALSLATTVSSSMDCSAQQHIVSCRTPTSKQQSDGAFPQNKTHHSLSTGNIILTSPCHKNIRSTVTCEVASHTDNLQQNSVLAVHEKQSSTAGTDESANPDYNASQKSGPGFIVHQNSMQQKGDASLVKNESVPPDYCCQVNACEISHLSTSLPPSSRQDDTPQSDAVAALHEKHFLPTKTDVFSNPDHTLQKMCHNGADGFYAANQSNTISSVQSKISSVLTRSDQSSAFNDSKISDLGTPPSAKQDGMDAEAVLLADRGFATQINNDSSKPVCSSHQKNDGFSVVQYSKTLDNVLSPQKNESGFLSTGKNISISYHCPSKISDHASMSPSFTMQKNMESKPGVFSAVCIICPSTLQTDVLSNQNFNVEEKGDPAIGLFDASQRFDSLHSVQNETNLVFNTGGGILTDNYCQSGVQCQKSSAAINNADRSLLLPLWGSTQTKSNTTVSSEVIEECSSAINGSFSFSNENMQKTTDTGASKSIWQKSDLVALSPSKESSVLKLKEDHSENSSEASKKTEISSCTGRTSSVGKDNAQSSTFILGKPCNAIFKGTVTFNQDCSAQPKFNYATVTELQTPIQNLIVNPLPSDEVLKSEANHCKSRLHSNGCSEILDHVSDTLSLEESTQVVSGALPCPSASKNLTSCSDCSVQQKTVDSSSDLLISSGQNLNGISIQNEINSKHGRCEQCLQTGGNGRMLDSASSAELSPSSDSPHKSTHVSVISQQCVSSASACSMLLKNDVSVTTSQSSKSSECHTFPSKKESSPVLNGTGSEQNTLQNADSLFSVKDCFKTSEQSEKTCRVECQSGCKNENRCSTHLNYDSPVVFQHSVSKDLVEFCNANKQLAYNQVADVHVISIGKIQPGEESDFETGSDQHLYKLSFRTDCGSSGTGTTNYLSCTVKTNNRKTDFHDDAPVFIPKGTLLKVLNTVPLQSKTLADMGSTLEGTQYCHDVLLPRPVPFSATQTSILSSSISKEAEVLYKSKLKHEVSSKGMLENDAIFLGKDCSTGYDDLEEQSVSYKCTSICKTPLKRKSFVEEKWHKAKKKYILCKNDIVNNIKQDSAVVRTRKLHLLSSGNQLVKCSGSTQPVVVLNHPDIAVPEMANLMRAINKMKGCIKVAISEKNNSLAIKFQSRQHLIYRGFAPVRLLNEHHILKINPKRLHASRCQTLSVASMSVQHPFQCWFCGRLYVNQKKWLAHGRHHLKEAAKKWNILSLCSE